MCLVVFKNLVLKISQESITSKLFINNGLPLLIFTNCELPGVSALICFNDFIVMSLSKDVWESAHVQWGCQREHGQWVPSFAFSAQSTAGFPAFPGRRDIVAMAISEAGSSWRGCVCQGIEHGREVVAKGWRNIYWAKGGQLCDHRCSLWILHFLWIQILSWPLTL